MFEVTEELLTATEKKRGSPITRLNLANNGMKSIGKLPLIKDTLIMLNVEGNNFQNLDGFEVFQEMIELNVAQNRITNIDPLMSLLKLESLDLTGNRIRSLDQLHALKYLNRLRILKLAGNPICVKVEYPVEIFRLQPCLQEIDTCKRQEVEEAIGESLSPSLPQSAQQQQEESKTSPTSPLPQQQTVVQYKPNDDHQALEQQLQVMHEAFSLQEKALLPSAKDATSLCLTPQLLPGHQSEIQKIHEHFPYVKLLSLWRKQAYTAILQNTLTQEKIKVLYSDMHKTREIARIEYQKLEFSELKYQSQNSALESRNSQLTTQLHQLTEKLTNCEFEMTRLNEEKMKEKLSFQKLSKFLQILQHEISQRLFLTQETFFSSVINRLGVFENRLQSLLEEVEIVQEMIAVKELNLRNSNAVLVAKTRLLHSQQSSANVTYTAGRITGEEVKANLSSNLSEVVISVEGESLLKAIFRSLDGFEDGLVSVTALYRALFQSATVAVEGEEEEEEGEELTELGILVRRALGSSAFTVFTANLHSLLLHTTTANSIATARGESDSGSSSDGKLCWGEVLLLLIPNPSPTSTSTSTTVTNPIGRVGLTRQEIRLLSQDHLLDTWENGVIPLQLPPSTTTTPSTSVVVSDTSEEVKRLRKERKFLLQKLQLSSRHMTRNCEEIKYFFDSQIRLLTLQKTQIFHENHDLQSQVLTLQNRFLESETVLQHTREKLELQIQTLELENERIKTQLSDNKSQQIIDFENRLLQEQTKHQLISEDNVRLSREKSKLEGKVSRLTHDNQRLQHQLATQETKLKSLTTQNEALQDSQRALEASYRKDNLQRELECEDEKKELLARLSQLQAKLLESQEQRMKLEEEKVQISALLQERQIEEQEREESKQQQQQQQVKQVQQPRLEDITHDLQQLQSQLNATTSPQLLPAPTGSAAGGGATRVRSLNHDQINFTIESLIRKFEEGLTG